jgi:hypothetical protein
LMTFRKFANRIRALADLFLLPEAPSRLTRSIASSGTPIVADNEWGHWAVDPRWEDPSVNLNEIMLSDIDKYALGAIRARGINLEGGAGIKRVPGMDEADRSKVVLTDEQKKKFLETVVRNRTNASGERDLAVSHKGTAGNLEHEGFSFLHQGRK